MEQSADDDPKVPSLADLGWSDEQERSWTELGTPGMPARVARIDRGWSALIEPATGARPARRVRNLGADVAVGDWVVPSADGERVEHVLARHSAFVRRASFDGLRAVADTLAANVDVVFLVHAFGAPPSPRRLERELVLAFDSGAEPMIVLTKSDLVADPAPAVDALAEVALGVPILVVSSVDRTGLDQIGAVARGGRTLVLLGASGVGKSSLVNALVGNERMETSDVRAGDQRGRHTTVAAELVPVPTGGWLIDTPGVRAVSLWLSGNGIERAFADVFDLMDRCRFRDCRHDREPGCAVRAAIDAGELDPVRLASLRRLVDEEEALEEEQRAQLKAADKRAGGRTRPPDAAEFD